MKITLRNLNFELELQGTGLEKMAEHFAGKEANGQYGVVIKIDRTLPDQILNKFCPNEHTKENIEEIRELIIKNILSVSCNYIIQENVDVFFNQK